MFYQVVKSLLNAIRSEKDKREHKKLADFVLADLAIQNPQYTKEFFNKPTLHNTSILRDYIHHQMTPGHKDLPRAVYYKRRASMLQLLRWLQQKKYRVLCGGLAQLLHALYKGLGYDSVLCDWVAQTAARYTDSHMLVEVYLPDLNKYVIQDPSFNIVLKKDQDLLNSLDLMGLLHDKDALQRQKIQFVNDQNGEEGVFTRVSEMTYENYFTKYFGQICTWRSGSVEMYPAVKKERIYLEN